MQTKFTLAALAIAVIAGTGWYATRSAETTSLPFAAAAQDAEADKSLVQEMALGREDAPVTVVEYASFTCPHCGNFHNSTFEQIKANYIDTGKVRFVYREVYFDRFGLWAGMVARCGDGQRYFGIADLLYERQQEWTAGGDPATIVNNLRTIGKTAGLSDQQLDACLADGDMAQALVAVYQDNQAADDIRSTPTFIIDGEKHTGNMSYADFARILEEKLGS